MESEGERMKKKGGGADELDSYVTQLGSKRIA